MGCQIHQPEERDYQKSLNAPFELETISELKAKAPLDYPWWSDLKSEELNRWMHQIEKNNLGLKQMQARLLAAESRYRVVASNRDPSLTANFGGDRRDGIVNTGLNPAFLEKWIHDFGLSTSWELDIWGELKANRLAEENTVAALSEDLKNLKLSLKGQLARAYIQWVSLTEKISTVNEQVKLEQESLDILEARFAQGRSTSLAVLQQREALVSRSRELPQLEMQKSEWERQLAILLGQHKIEITESKLKLPEWSVKGAEFHIKPTQIFDQRPDLKAQWYRLLESDQLLIASKAARWPSLTLNLSVSGSDDSLSELPDSLLSVISADLLAPIFDQNNRKQEVVRRTALQNEQLYKLKELSLNALHEVENAYNGIYYLNRVYEELERQMSISKQAYREAQFEYLNGQLDYINVLRERSGLYLNQKTQVDMKRDLWNQKIDLFMSLGWNGMSREQSHAK